MTLPLLHHDDIVEAATPAGSAAAPEHRLAVLHGIYGGGRNWASVARRVVRARPEWGASLVDLREHGDSTGFPPPHTVEAAAEDLLRTFGEDGPAPAAVLGHSFGGKVALEYLRAADRAGATLPRQVWVVDSTPEAREPGGSAWEMLAVLREHPGPFRSRDAGVSALEAGGVATPVARWMATNLADDAGDGAWRWRIDPDSMEALLRDFFARDAWDVVESPPGATEILVVKAAESSVLSGEALERMEAAARHERVHLHRVDGGHWLNADNPDALVELLVARLP